MKQNTTYKQTELGLIPEDWEVKKLGECSSISGDYGINAPAVKFSEDLPTYLRITDIDDDGNYSKENKVSVKDDNSESFILDDEDIVFARTGATVGKTYLHNKKENGDLVFAGFLIRFRTNFDILLPYYLKLYTNTDKYWNWVSVFSMRSGQPGINSKEYSNLKIPLPPLAEQKKIADCLSTWDSAIEKQNALINALTDRKKALMQQLLTGKKRLPGFEGKWKEVKLGSICENFQNGNAFSAKDYKKTGIPIVTMGNINLGGYFYFSESKSNFWIEDKSLERYEIKKGDLIIAMTDVTPEKNLIGLTSIIDIDRIFYLNQRVGHIILKPKLADTDFIFYLSQNSYWRNQCKAFATLGVQANLGTNDIKNINIKLPSLSEQTAIAAILATADRELQLQKEKLAQLQTQKKGLMQVLLTGKKRLLN